MVKNELCCSAPMKKNLDGLYWNSQYEAGTTSWDLGEVSPPIKQYIDGITNKGMRILIPGCGNTYEADYLVQQGFTNITLIDIAPLLVDQLQRRFKGNTAVTVILGDFFEHEGNYDLILEQTFFCALPPSMRTHYVAKMHELLAPKGRLSGVLFNRSFESGPPFGGDINEYRALFQEAFNALHFQSCYNSATPRAGSELFIELEKVSERVVSRYSVQGVGDDEAMRSLADQLQTSSFVRSVVMNQDYTDLLAVSTRALSLQELRELCSSIPSVTIQETGNKINQPI